MNLVLACGGSDSGSGPTAGDSGADGPIVSPPEPDADASGASDAPSDADQDATSLDGSLPDAGSDAADATLSDASDAGPDAVADDAASDASFEAGVDAGPLFEPPPINRTTASSIAQAVGFLYEGPNATQLDVDAAVISPDRVVALRGSVVDTGGAGVAGVRVSVVAHPEYGYTLSRDDGQYDLAINGGGSATIEFAKTGYPSVHRALADIPWQRFVPIPDVTLVAYDPNVTTIALGATAPSQMVRGSASLDDAGARQATILVPAGTQGNLTFSDGSTQPLATMNVRITEFTVGAAGPSAMPAALPLNTGYTYAAEFSADEAVAANATGVAFSAPVTVYLENFLHFAVGSPVPAGYYDRAKASWVPSTDGYVVEVLSTSGGTAVLDVDGTGVGASSNELATLGITSDELQQVASLYTVGEKLWRVQLPHFTPWDFNWPFGPDPHGWGPNASNTDAGGPHPGFPTPPGPNPHNPDNCPGSQIGVQSQTLGERIALKGTPYTLHYSSDRVPGRTSDYTLNIPLAGAEIPPNLKRIDLEVDIAGRVIHQSFLPTTAQSTTFVWDGLDVYGRRLQGSQPVHTVLGYVFDGVMKSAGGGASCGAPPMPPSLSFSHYTCDGQPATGDMARQEVSLEFRWDGLLGHWDASGDGLGGFSISAHNAFDPLARVVYFGDGSRRDVNTVPPVMTTIAGTQNAGTGDGAPALTAKMPFMNNIAALPDGSIVVHDSSNNGAGYKRIDANGILSTLYGGALSGSSLEGNTVAADRDGTLLVLDVADHLNGNSRLQIKRLDLSGNLTVVAGSGTASPIQENTLASAAGFDSIAAIAEAPDGSVLVADNGHTSPAIYRVGTDGRVRSVIQGHGFTSTTAPNDVAVGSTWLDGYIHSMATGPDGSIYFADVAPAGYMLRRIRPDGVVVLVAGGGDLSAPLKDGPSAKTVYVQPTTLAVRPDGTVLFFDFHYFALRAVSPSGAIATIAGAGTNLPKNGPGPAYSMQFSNTYGATFALEPDGNIVLAGATFIYRIQPAVSGSSLRGWQVADDDGRALYFFDGLGRHLRTVDTFTNAVLDQFLYNGDGTLAGIVNAVGDTTTITRDNFGRVTGVVGPYGEPTTLHTNADGWLDRVTDANGNATSFSYTGATGLMSSLTDPRSNVHNFTFDASGRLLSDTAPTGSSTSLASNSSADGLSSSATATSALGNVDSHTTVITTNPTSVTRQSTGPTGLVMSEKTAADGSSTISMPDGTILTTVAAPDPRFGMDVPVTAKATVTTPGGITANGGLVRTATLSDPVNLLSLTSAVETYQKNGATRWTNTYSTVSGTKQFVAASPSGRKVTTKIDNLGRPTEVDVVGVAPVFAAYDPHGHLTTITHGSRTYSFTFDANGHPTVYTDPAGKTETRTFDPAGRVKLETLADGRQIQFSYDAADNLATLIPPPGATHTFTRNAGAALASYVAPPAPPALPSATTTQWSYDLDGQLRSLALPDGASIGWVNDHGRATSITYPTGSIAMTYDAAGRVGSVAASNGETTSYAYDGFLWKSTTWSGSIAGSVGITYDNNLRVVAQGVNGASIAYGYDADGLLTSAGELTVGRDAGNGRVTTTIIEHVNDALSYDPTYGDFSAYSASVDTTALYSLSVTRDPVGRIASKSETVSGTTHAHGYTYDDVGRLTDVTTDGTPSAHYEYDPNGNRITYVASGVTTTSTYDAQDRVLTSGGDSYSYGAAGELLLRGQGAAMTAYAYDTLGNLTSVTLPSGKAITYVLDGNSLRVGRYVDGVLSQGFLYQNQLKPVAEVDASGSVTARFVYASRGQTPDFIQKGGKTYRVLSDQLGSPRLIVDVSNGQIAQELEYDAFGAVTLDTSPGFQPFGFAGGLYDPDTQLVHFGSREYDAKTARWLSKDPKGFSAGQTNLYAYCFNDPLNRTDIDGDNPVIIIVAIILLIGGMGMSAPSDTKEAPADILGMSMSVVGAPAMGSAPAWMSFAGMDADAILQQLVDQSVRDLTRDPSIVASEKLLTPAEQAAVAGCKKLAPSAFGRALERRVAQQILDDPYLADLFEHVGDLHGPTGGPDFLGLGKFGGEQFEITTNAQLEAHQARWYGNDVSYILYDNPGVYWIK